MSGVAGADGNQASAADQAVSAKSILKTFLIYLFKPTVFGVVMLVIFLPMIYILSSQVVHYLLSHYLNMNMIPNVDLLEIKLYVTFGFGILLTYIILNILCRKLVNAGKPIRILRLWMISFALFIVISFPASIITSKYNWGYYFSRPEVFSELRDVEKITRVIPVNTIKDGGGSHFIFNVDYSMQDKFSWAKRSPYYALDTRNLLFFKDAGRALPEVSRLPRNGLDYYKLVKDNGILAPPDPGYKRSVLLRGLIIDAIDAAGRELVLIAVSGGELSNDHYPYYELLFEKKPGVERPVLISSQLFFYDVAGIEGAEWYYILLFYAVLSGYLAFLLTVLIAVVRRIMSWIASKHRPPARAS